LTWRSCAWEKPPAPTVPQLIDGVPVEVEQTGLVGLRPEQAQAG
jgi:hypothetical protein